MIGAAPLYPGSRLLLKLDFPVGQPHPLSNQERWIACHQVSACLQAMEVAIHANNSSNNNKNNEQRARKHLLATTHWKIDDPSATESIALNLIVPEAAPCSIATDCVEIAVQRIVDLCITAADPSNSNRAADGGNYRNLHLEIPCRITHAPADWESEHRGEQQQQQQQHEEDESPSKRLFEQLVRVNAAISGTTAAATTFSASNNSVRDHGVFDPCDPRSFQYQDIVDELKLLSLLMADACGLRPVPKLLPPPFRQQR